MASWCSQHFSYYELDEDLSLGASLIDFKRKGESCFASVGNGFLDRLL